MEIVLLVAFIAIFIGLMIYCVKLANRNRAHKGWGPGPSIDDVLEKGRQDLKSTFSSKSKKD